ncbi:FeoA family protein [Pseudodesulfovibrio piezophilus]|uniref:FeoA family protein n=1 Tax=Pseudodesulfovibrio piezophilus (strain DSM 21447 / JCM 15486 / C1TLV30) TaxID=1322246 RepID=M1WY67_PSEP2|nr:FeoA family protein [Pseudodesulfovibrio piezophilus]CCH50168.1 FeoA family protein [Pseudodesulfovibrio piezophilus C1TLV30]
MTLNELKPGSRCTMTDLTAVGALGQRLMDLGFYPGAEIEVVRNAPLVDPVELHLDGYHVSIRHNEAKHIEVER